MPESNDLTETEQVDHIYEDYRYEVPDPYGFALTYRNWYDNKKKLDELAVSWNLRALESRKRELLLKRSEIDEKLADVASRIAALTTKADEE
jgi:hypothetical protein